MEYVLGGEGIEASKKEKGEERETGQVGRRRVVDKPNEASTATSSLVDIIIEGLNDLKSAESVENE